jgi:hypothetical protein
VALQTAAAGAAAMGLPFIVVDAAFVLPGAVSVRVLATDRPPGADEGEARGTPDAADESSSDHLTGRSIKRPTF